MMSEYRPLSESQAIEYARNIPDLFEKGADLESREIGDGNLNLVFHIKDPNNGKSVIMKQALPYAKVVGESWPLSLDRARIESEALQIQASLCPDLVPQVYLYDSTLALTVMEDLSDHIIMRRGLIEGHQYPNFAAHISRFLAQTLFFTSDFGMNQQEKKLRVKQFINPDLCKITEDLIFDDPYTDSPNNNFDEAIRDEVEQLWKDQALHLEVMKLREGFLTKSQSLLHGDLHTGSVFVTNESTKVIDPEFAYYGPMGFDIGAVFANLLLNAAAQEGWIQDDTKRKQFRTYLLESIESIWTSFEKQFRQLWNEHNVDRMATTPGYQDLYIKQLLKDTAGYTGSKMVRRIVGLAHVADIDTIRDPRAKETAQRNAIRIGKMLIKKHGSTESIKDIINTAKAYLE
jgi:5-methylthioribose kinase